MGVRGLTLGLWTLAATMCGSQAADGAHATLDKPAVMTAVLTGHLMTDTPGPPRVYLSIVAFTPPRDRKRVEIVVRASATPNGPARELGRAAIEPYVAFGVRNKSRRREFAFLVPAEFQSALRLTVSVALHPMTGSGAGASLDVGDASIR